MSKRMIRLFCLFVTAAMVFTLIACAETEEEPEETTAATTTTAAATTTAATTTTTAATTTEEIEESPFAEFYEISWLTGISDDQYMNDGFDQKMLEERYNVKFTIWNISNYDPEGLAMMLAAGDIPDISYIPHAPLDAIQLYDEGFTRSVPLDMHKQYFPYYYEKMLENAPSSFIYNNIRNEDGSISEEYYGISFIVLHYRLYYNVPLMRLDWLENIGYDIPEAELVPITLSDDKLGPYSGQTFITNHMWTHEEQNDIFRAFTEDDPNMNGEDDTYGGVIFHHNFRNHWTDLWTGQFGIVSHGGFLYEDQTTGDILPWYAHTGTRDYYEWAVDMRDRGYLRTLPEGYESLAPQGSWYDNLLANWMTGKIGYFFADRQYICRPDFPEYSDRQPPQSIWLNTDEQDATFVSFPVLAGPYGEGTFGTRRYSLDAFADGKFRTYNIGADVSDGKLARVLTMWNDRYTDEVGGIPQSDFWRQVLYGLEGVHFTWTGEPWASGMIRTEPEKIPDHYKRYGGFGGSFGGQMSPALNEAMSQYMPFFMGIDERGQDWPSLYTIEPVKVLSAMYMGIDMHTDYQETWNDVGSDIWGVVTEFRDRHWDGQIANIRTEWSEYIDQLYSAGLEQIVTNFFNNPEFEKYVGPTW